ncbi:hypothetical protein [Gluconobacter cerinus]|uniref:hypothetical protein n=1 Tax=Gluconobacter cerinus TaxID=38307 RepID=UPI001B8D9614|nr:hypothetical protein [Gluconobacter cerinus]MBS1025982.1 hypothetical protein [Gluconobacter cerinus]
MHVPRSPIVDHAHWITAQNLTNKRYYPGCLSLASGCYIGASRNVIGEATHS